MQLDIVVDHHNVVTVDLYRNPFVERWCKLLERTYAVCSINQQDSFSHALTESQAKARLSAAINTINRFLKHDFVPVADEQSWDSKDWYNQLHICFEKLSGEFGKPTKLFQLAPTDVKAAIRDLNFYVHRLEQRPYSDCRPWFVIFDKECYTRQDLEPQDYALFDHQVSVGTVFINYSELGKTYHDIYVDGLPIDYAGIKNSHYYSAEFAIWLDPDRTSLFESGFYNWAEQHNINVNDKTLGLGTIPIGQVRDVDTMKKIAYNGTQITDIRIYHG
jgi:hypothetical protein